MKTVHLKSIGSPALVLVLISLSSLCGSPCHANGDVVLPPPPPTLTHAEALAQSRHDSCQNLRRLTRSGGIKLTGEGRADYHLLCSGVPDSNDSEMADALNRILIGLVNKGAIVTQDSDAAKIADSIDKVNYFIGSVYEGIDRGYGDQDRQIFSTGAGSQ